MDTKIFIWLVCLLTLLRCEPLNAGKKLNASQAFDDNWSSASDLENELEQKRSSNKNQGRQAASGSAAAATAVSAIGQWSGWSEWSTCSRTCDGGIMQQIRRCSNRNGCRGESVRHRICNMQPCPEQQDFRAQQCSAYNDVPYDGTLYKWTPHYDYIEPCALTCRGRPAHLSDDEMLYNTETEAAASSMDHYDEQSVVVQLSARVQDGTRCRTGSLDMCIQGKCQRVGCDLKIGSGKKIDACGICGGDGSLCSQALYYWEISPLAPCSVVCGGGYKMSQAVCKSRVTGGIVADNLCTAASRPESPAELCNTEPCPPRWIADDWSSCSHLCGNGFRERMVICAEENNGIRLRVADILCGFPKPPNQEPCIIAECPKWAVEDWSECSVTCGQGIQVRSVECKANDGSLSAKCDPQHKPTGVRQCTAISCDNINPNAGKIIIGSSHHGAGDLMDHTINSSDFDDEDDEDDEVMSSAEDEGDDPGSFEAMPYRDSQEPYYLHQFKDQLNQEEPHEPIAQALKTKSSNRDASLPSSDPTFVLDSEWSACSVTCGEGIRRRPYKCKIYLEYSRTIATVNDTLCEGERPLDEVERCVKEPCMLSLHNNDDQYPRDSIKVGVSDPGKTYVWREQGYTSCSASCLGGVEELIINCVREDNGRVVSPFLCALETKPEARVRTCNDRPCPPRWNFSDYTPCTKSCGIGIKTREVQCIHEVTRGGENTMVVPNSMCPQPHPVDRQYCNVLDCPVRWEVGEWSKCSHTCGYGIKERKVECRQVMAQEHKLERPESMCPSVKPPDKKPCNVKPCPTEDQKPVIAVTNTTHIQHDPKKSKITLKIGGAGVVFFGTQVKIKCPVKRFNRTKIKWSKDHKPLNKTRKFKISKKGALRILDITFRDAGIYSCHAGLSSAEISIEVKAKPGQNMAEVFGVQESERLVRERTGSEPLISADMTALDAVNGTQSSIQKKQQNQRERSRQKAKLDNLTKANVKGDEPQLAVHSGSNRLRALFTIPYFQMLLSNMQSFWPFLKHNSLAPNDDELWYTEKLKDHMERRAPLMLQLKEPASSYMMTNNALDSKAANWLTHNKNWYDIRAEQNLTQQQASSAYLWHTSDWSQCQKRCGAAGNGVRTRNATCVSKLLARPHNDHSSNGLNYGTGAKQQLTIVNAEQCLEFGLKMPHVKEVCATAAEAVEDIMQCPKWTPTMWSICSKSRCIKKFTALQRRRVYCRYSNHTTSKECNPLDKPNTKQECYNKRCRGVWRVEQWSKCHAACGRTGVKYRILQCVWYGSRRPAGNECKQLPRPEVMKVCKSERCFPAAYECKDNSSYCRSVYKMGLCQLQQYQKTCCVSCSK